MESVTWRCVSCLSDVVQRRGGKDKADVAMRRNEVAGGGQSLRSPEQEFQSSHTKLSLSGRASVRGPRFLPAGHALPTLGARILYACNASNTYFRPH